MAAAVLLAACGTSSTPDDGIASAKSGWTTLGTRAAPAHDGKTITKNADAVWSDYDPAPLYAGSKSLPLQYITMRDGVQLAAYVTVPADADGNAIDTRSDERRLGNEWGSTGRSRWAPDPSKKKQ